MHGHNISGAIAPSKNTDAIGKQALPLAVTVSDAALAAAGPDMHAELSDAVLANAASQTGVRAKPKSNARSQKPKKDRRRRLVVIAHPSGSMWKTQTSIGLVDHLRRAGIQVVPIAIDTKSHLSAVFKDAITLELADAEAADASEIADALQLEPLLERILDLPEGATIVLDCGANTVERVVWHAACVDLADDLTGWEVVLLVPLRPVVGATKGAVETVALWRSIIPELRVVPYLCGADCVERLMDDELALFEENFASSIEAGEAMIHPEATPRSLDVMSRMKKPAFELANVDDETARGFTSGRMLGPGRKIRANLTVYAADLDAAFSRIFRDAD